MPINLPTILQSKPIAYQNGTIVSATLVIADSQLSATNAFLFYLSADGGSNWEQVTRNTKHNFTNTGDDLRYRIIGNPGAELKVRNSAGVDTPIKVLVNPT